MKYIDSERGECLTIFAWLVNIQLNVLLNEDTIYKILNKKPNRFLFPHNYSFLLYAIAVMSIIL